ncbi:hypothetical protein ABZ848_27850 [Streptomyces sp. NPDC047081]
MTPRVLRRLDATTASQHGHTHDGTLPAFAQGPSRTAVSHQTGGSTCR